MADHSVPAVKVLFNTELRHPIIQIRRRNVELVHCSVSITRKLTGEMLLQVLYNFIRMKVQGTYNFV